jgi:serine/threonine protein kinase
MARAASKESIGAVGTRFFGEGAIEAGLAAPDRAASKLEGGSVIDGKYRLERIIGEGGMGSVWSAHNLQLDLPVAIKLLRAGPDQAISSERLKLEARAAARLVHPAIVRVFDIDTSEGGEPFIVMELLEGESLSDLLDREPLTGVEAVQMLLPIVDALSLAHAKGIVHRDLKPHNIFISQDGERRQPKLLDFGIAKLTSAPRPTSNLTDTGILLGSPDYMSPEQARGSHDIDYRADIWSLCVVLYEAIASRTPFNGDNYNALMRAIVEDEPAPLRLDENVDQRLANLIAWGLSKDRTQRPASIQQLGRDLAQWLIERGAVEDVCGNALGPKWITRSLQKSLPAIPLEAPEVSSPPVMVRSDTLVSARDLPGGTNGAGPLDEPIRAAVLPARRYIWALAAGALALGGSIAWALSGTSMPGPHGASEPGPRPATSPAAEQAAHAMTSPPASVAPVEIAATPPEPPRIEAVSRAPAGKGNSASPLPSPSALSKSRAPKTPSEAGKSPPAAKPGQDVHDEARELLQAY